MLVILTVCWVCGPQQMRQMTELVWGGGGGGVFSVGNIKHPPNATAAVILGLLNSLLYLFGWTGPHRITRSLWVKHEYPPSELDPIGSCCGSSCHAIIGMFTLALGFFVELPPLSGDRDDISNFCLGVSCFCLPLCDVGEDWWRGRWVVTFLLPKCGPQLLINSGPFLSAYVITKR
jgi:hypothetical protein